MVATGYLYWRHIFRVRNSLLSPSNILIVAVVSISGMLPIQQGECYVRMYHGRLILSLMQGGQSSSWLFRRLHCAFLDNSLSFVNQSVAIQKNLTYVTYDGKVIMKADDYTTLPSGTYRDRSVYSIFRCLFTWLILVLLNEAYGYQAKNHILRDFLFWTSIEPLGGVVSSQTPRVLDWIQSMIV